jgi:RPA family protein
VREILEGEFRRGGDRWEPSHVVVGEERVSRARVMGTVVSKFVSDDRKYGALTIDDGSGAIHCRAFRESVELLLRVKVGDLVDVIGRVKEYDGERYLNLETLWVVGNPNWEIVRRLELLKRRAPARRVEVEKVAEEPEGREEDPKLFVLNLIESMDEGEGVKYLDLLRESGLDEERLEDLLNELMREGEIYEPKIGRFRRV